MRQPRTDLERFFHPRGVALVGSVDRHGDPDALRRNNDARWGSRWYLVNARGGRVGDVRVYERVTDIPDKVELAVININPQLVPGSLEECGHHGVPYVLIFSAGFSEVGEEGLKLEKHIAEIAKSHGIRVLGPNTNTNAFERLPDPTRVRGGRIGLVTQSGHQGRPIVQGTEFGIAFSRWVPTGNEVDLEAADFIEYFAYDDDTAVIAGYFEGFRDPERLHKALQAANSQRKPVVAIKVGSTRAGARMASSHTGHLSGSDQAVDGLFAQHGVVRVRDLDELLETAGLFAKLQPGTGPRCCLYSISGGSGALMAEVAEAHGVPTPPLLPETQKRLRDLIPYYLPVGNPVDNGATFLLTAPEEDRRRVFELIAGDPGIDVIVVALTGALGPLTDRFAKDIVTFADDLSKPVVATWNSFKTDEKGFALLVESGLPLFRSFRNCFAALSDHAGYERAAAQFRKRARPSAQLNSEAIDALSRPRYPIRPPRHRTILGAPLANGTDRQVLGAEGSSALLRSFGLPVIDEVLASSAKEAVQAAQAIGYPVAMKLASPDVPHKADASLVELGVASGAAVRARYRELRTRPELTTRGARVEGVLVQRQVRGGVEMIVGVAHDPVLGPTILVGSGGVFAEVLRDVAVRPIPIDLVDVEDMVASLRIAPLLHGQRGVGRVDRSALHRCVLSVARLAAAMGPDLLELDLNPVIVSEEGAYVVDSLVVLRGGAQ